MQVIKHCDFNLGILVTNKIDEKAVTNSILYNDISF